MNKQFRGAPFPTLNSPRLKLRPVLRKDTGLVFHLRSDEELNKFILREPLQKEGEALQFIEENEIKVREGKLIHWTLEVKSNLQGIGNICLWNFSADGKSGELGYSLIKAYQGQGLMSEAVKLVLAFGFIQLDFTSIEAYTQNNNQKSIGLLERFGFVHNPSKNDPHNSKNIVYELERRNWLK